MQLIENSGEVSLYKNDAGQIIATYNDKTLTLQGIRYNQPFTFDSDDEGWVPFSADIYDDPYSNENDGNIVFLWRNPGMGENNGPGWEALSYSSSDGSLLGAYDIYGTFYDPQAMYDFDNKYGSDAWPERHIFGLGNTQYTTDKAKIIDSLGTIFGDIYNGIIKESAKTYSLNQEYELGGIKDFDGNPHANIEDISETAKKSYKYQGSIDVNKDGIFDGIERLKAIGIQDVENFTGNLLAQKGVLFNTLSEATFNKDGYTNLYEIVTMEGHEGKGYGSKGWEYFLDYAVNQKQSKRLKISCTPSSVTWHMRNGLVFWAVDPSGSLRSDQPLFATRGEQLEFRAKAIVTPSIAKPTNPRVIEQLKKEAPESHGFGKKKMSATEEAITAVGECWLRDALYEDASLESLFD